MDPYAPRNSADPRHTPEADRLTDIILGVFRLYGLFEEHGARLARPYCQSTARWRVIAAAARQEGSVSQIARSVGLTRQGVQRTANVLASEGLLAFADNPAHRRSPIVRLTPRGEHVLRCLSNAQIEWSNALANGMDIERLEQAAAVLRDFADRLNGPGSLPARGSTHRAPKRRAAPNQDLARPAAN